MSEINAKTDNEISADSAKRVYELGYLLVPTIPEEDLAVAYGDLKELILSLGGVGISDEMPKKMTLAYQMIKIIDNAHKKFDSAYFGWTKFFMDSEKIQELKSKLDVNPNFLRYLITKTVKENTIAAKKFLRRDSLQRRTSVKRSDTAEVAEPINKEEIDKEIDALIAN